MLSRYFDELAWGLAWKPETLLAMIWHYYDESGEHDSSGALMRLTVGGAIARMDQWNALDGPWKDALSRAGVQMFHMAKFEAWESPFDFRLSDGSRDQDKHHALLNALLDAIIAHVDHMVGFVGDRFPAGRGFEDAYAENIAKAIRHALIDGHQEPVTMVFAKHKDFKAGRIAKFFERWDEPGRLEFGGIGEPANLPQLQVADIVAYELSRWSRRTKPERERYPLQRLKTAFAAKPGAKFLLTSVP